MPIGERIRPGMIAFLERIFPDQVTRIRARRKEARYQLRNPVSVTTAGIETWFWVKNRSDWFRIGVPEFELACRTRLLEILAKERNLVFADVGSAQGLYSIPAAMVCSQVYAIDPDPSSQQSLSKNLELNSAVAGKVSPLPIALGAEQGEMTLYVDSYDGRAPSLRRIRPELAQGITVPVWTMDQLVAQGKMLSPDVVKIDVEGAEALVIEGMKQTRPSHLFVEIHSGYLPFFGSTAEQVKLAISSRGYRFQESWQRDGEELCHYQAV